MEEYIVISKTALEKRIEELIKKANKYKKEELENMFVGYLFQIKDYKQILSQSTPLIPVLEKAYMQGALDFQMNGKEFTNGDEKDYISNLKLDI